jgi:hypothetical protein
MYDFSRDSMSDWEMRKGAILGSDIFCKIKDAMAFCSASGS